MQANKPRASSVNPSPSPMQANKPSASSVNPPRRPHRLTLPCPETGVGKRNREQQRDCHTRGGNTLARQCHNLPSMHETQHAAQSVLIQCTSTACTLQCPMKCGDHAMFNVNLCKVSGPHTMPNVDFTSFRLQCSMLTLLRSG